MQTRLSAKGLHVLSNVIISFFAVVSLAFFLLTIDRSAIIEIITVLMLAESIYLMWAQSEFDSISLLIFFFGTTACFFFFSDVIASSASQGASVLVFAFLSLVLSNYLLNTTKPVHSPEKSLYKVTLAIVFTEIFWVLSFLQISQLSKGAIAAIIFFNFQTFVRDILEKSLDGKKLVFLLSVSIILLAIIILRI